MSQDARAAEGPVVLIGAGGHAKVVIGILRAAGRTVRAAFDDTPDKWGGNLLGVPIRPLHDYTHEAGTTLILAIGENLARQQLDQSLRGPFSAAVHPSAWVDPSAVLGPGTVVCAGAVVQAEAVIGKHVIVNTSASIDHDCTLGDFAHVAPGAHLAGRVTVGEGALLGVGSSVLPGLRIGAWATVGVGAAVVTDVPDGVVAMGVPARRR